MNYFIIEIKGKNPRRLLTKIIKDNINLYDITYYKDKITFKTSYKDYIKINNIKTIYEINIIDIKGIKKIKLLIKKYFIFIIFFIMGLISIIFLMNHIFFININSSSKEINDLIMKELDNNNLTLYTKKKSYKTLEYITNKIKRENSDKIEWLSIYYNGVYLNVEVIERINNDISKEDSFYDIVASNNGYIIDIYSESGELLKVKGDYVNKDDIIISGNIYRNGKVIGKTSAKGKVYAEVWYKVSLSKDLITKEKVKTDDGYNKLIITIFNKDIELFKYKKKIKNEVTKNIFNSSILSIKLSKSYIYKEVEKKYNDKELINLLKETAKDSINKNLDDDEYIILQKTLKNYKENGKMYIEVFFKVYKDIAVRRKSIDIEE